MNERRQSGEETGGRTTVEGTVRSVVFHNEANGYTVLHVELPSEFELARSPEITVVGRTQAVWEGEEVRAEGEWVTDKVHGRQFRADSLVCVAPRSLKGIERYLASGLIKGIGPVLAKRIVDTFGDETMTVLSHQSGRLSEVPRRFARSARAGAVTRRCARTSSSGRRTAYPWPR